MNSVFFPVWFCRTIIKTDFCCSSFAIFFLFPAMIYLSTSCHAQPDQESAPHNTADSTRQTFRLAGTYEVVSAKEYVQNNRAATEVNFYGPNPKGRLMLDERGNYMLTVMVGDLPRFVDNNGKDVGREQGSDLQNRKVVQGSIANFGKYKDSSQNLVLIFEKATYPNWDAPFRQIRPYRISGDLLIYEVPNASSGNGKTAEFIWKRVPQE